jgi:hypothetical protein
MGNQRLPLRLAGNDEILEHRNRRTVISRENQSREVMGQWVIVMRM